MGKPKTNPAGSTDDWFTRLEDWEPWDRKFHFNLDLAGHPDAPVSRAIVENGGRALTGTEELRHGSRDPGEVVDGLRDDCVGKRVWCNPPFSLIRPWVAHAHHVTMNGCPLFTMLLPANKTEQPWWHQFVEPFRDTRRYRLGDPGLYVQFIEKRLRFGFPGSPDGKGGTQPRSGHVLLTWSGGA